MWGAQGNYSNEGNNPTKEGYGGYVSGDLSLAKNSTLYIYVGQHTHSSNYYQAVFNNSSVANQNNNSHHNSSGGGATDIRAVNGAWNNANSLRSRIMVAGAGGGMYRSDANVSNRGNAGGLNGYGKTTNATSSSNSCAKATENSGGTQISGGLKATVTVYSTNQTDGGFGYGGNGATAGTSPLGGGGGSGWYGGGGGTHYSGECASGGGGGSSYISGHTGSVAVTSTSSSSPKSGCTTGTTNNACSITPYINPATNVGYTFTNTVMIDGTGYKWTNTKESLQAMPNPSGGNYASGVGHSGNGYARITYLGTSI